MSLKSMFFKCWILFLIFFGNKVSAQEILKSVSIDTLLNEKISIRAIITEQDKVWYAGDKGRYGFIDLKTKIKTENKISDESKLEFRSIASNSEAIFLLAIGNPALLYKVSKKSLIAELVYKENHDKVFYDSMQFSNENQGIAIGDPIENSFSIIVTNDAGNSWLKIPSGELPFLKPGEAAFAASNSNIVIKKNKTWIVSGGTDARIFYSGNKGKKWEVYKTPIISGSAMTGIFTADFFDQNNGFIAGGDYEKPNQNFGNKAITSDGGKTWKLVAENSGPGYISCVQYFPECRSNELLTVGASGIHYSLDRGSNWFKLSDDKDLFTIRFLDKNTAIVAGKNKMLRLAFQN